MFFYRLILLLLLVFIFQNGQSQYVKDVSYFLKKLCSLSEIKELRKYQKINGKNVIYIFQNSLLKCLNVGSFQESDICLMDEGGVYYYDVQYLLQFDKISVTSDEVTLEFFTSSRYKGEHSKNMIYFSGRVVFRRNKENQVIWEVKSKKFDKIKCCLWKVD